MKIIIVSLLLNVYAHLKGNKLHFLHYLYTSANSFKYNDFYVYKNEVMFVFDEYIHASDISYNRIVRFTHMEDVHVYEDDNSFKVLKGDDKVVLCIMKVGEDEKEVIKVPIVVSDMHLVKRFYPVNPWMERTPKP